MNMNVNSDLHGQYRDVVLTRLKVAVQQALSNEFVSLAATARVGATIDHITDQMIFRLSAHVLAEQLPPQRLNHRIHLDDTQFASWWDHFKHEYRSRWWMRWRRWTVHTVTHSIDRVVTVNVRDHWTYPQARIVLPKKDWGRPVMVSVLDVSDRPVRRDEP